MHLENKNLKRLFPFTSQQWPSLNRKYLFFRKELAAYPFESYVYLSLWCDCAKQETQSCVSPYSSSLRSHSRRFIDDLERTGLLYLYKVLNFYLAMPCFGCSNDKTEKSDLQQSSSASLSPSPKDSTLLVCES